MENRNALFSFDTRPSDSLYVNEIWRTQYEGMEEQFISIADIHNELVITKENGIVSLTIHGAETQASHSPLPQNADFVGISFKMGAFMPHLPNLTNTVIQLPQANNDTFWLNGSAWQIPTYDNADIFVNRLVREGLLVYEPIVEATLQGHIKELS
ncbi:MAG TPA: hypothetical protein PLZ51_24395, partial [Aggregatilineales bacterium]|nr:hypothetical protein [Aggregatilineales bacterium]